MGGTQALLVRLFENETPFQNKLQRRSVFAIGRRGRDTTADLEEPWQ
ncbi:hypothetical protein [Bradyrhizobium tropiciagri]|nr:hypothetical protein [Bradyrhizobium tropiciagri]